jgi:hypothetical protein
VTTDTTEFLKPSAASGWILFAVAMMIVVGAIDIIQGLSALLKETVFVIPGGEGALLVTTSYDAWGWALIIWGIVLILSALSLFAAKGWGRWFAFVVVIVHMIGQIAWFPAYPLWSLVAIGLGVGVLWALTAGWKDVKEEMAT